MWRLLLTYSLLALSLLLVASCNKEPSSAASAPTTDAVVPKEIAPQPVVEQTSKPADPWPSGDATAEGVACDLARSFVNADTTLFRQSCMQETFGRSEKYKEFLNYTEDCMRKVKQNPRQLNGGPVEILKVYKARYLSKNGPGSYGYAAFDFKNVMFVDVETKMEDGSTYTNRTLVFQKADKT